MDKNCKHYYVNTADMRGGGVKEEEKIADAFYVWTLSAEIFGFYSNWVGFSVKVCLHKRQAFFFRNFNFIHKQLVAQ